MDSAPSPAFESIRAAKAARLFYVSDREPGIRRRGRPGRFRYVRHDGSPLRDGAALRRIASLVIPPAWEEVWICRRPNGHIQAVGRDARGRKQYRYHPRWRIVRDGDKYAHILDFARALPKLRRRVAADLRRPGLPREKIIAAIVRLLEATLIRVGNDEYAEQNGSYGLTTIRNGHVRVRGGRLEFAFRGKSGKSHRIDVEDPKLARIVRRCQELPGQRLFEYVDETGRIHSVGSHDVNGYLGETAGREYTAKDFRTWIGTVLAAIAFGTLGSPASMGDAKQQTVSVIESVARLLGNTAAVCRRCYIHPEIIAAYSEGICIEVLPGTRAARRFRKEEKAVLALLRRRLRSRR